MTTSAPAHHPPAIYRHILIALGVVIVILLALRMLYPGRPAAASELSRINIVPPFSLTERSGRTITNRDLFGKIWVADFVYTTCPGPCPLVTASMAKLQDALAHDPRVQLVTFTVDPKTDTPAVLSAYADRFGADKNRWWFLTGPESQMYALIRNGFFLPVVDTRGQPAEPGQGQFTVTHSTHFALVDASGVVRGFFDGIHPDGRTAVLKAIAMLEQEKP